MMYIEWFSPKLAVLINCNDLSFKVPKGTQTEISAAEKLEEFRR